jgi:hypothetical protein
MRESISRLSWGDYSKNFAFFPPSEKKVGFETSFIYRGENCIEEAGQIPRGLGEPAPNPFASPEPFRCSRY